FLAAHDFETLTDTLDYLDRLGVNAVELMPVSEFDGNLSWGYNPTFHLALDKYYGPAEDLKRFVDEAHKRGIAVIMDVVYNHAHGESPLVQLYGPTGDNPYINIPATHPFNVFYDLNHENPYVQYWLDRANAHWLEDFDVDGFRIDLAGGFMQTGDFFGYNPERVALLTRMAEKIWETDSTAYVILEDLIDSGQEYEELTTYGRDRGRPGALVWHNMNQAYSQSTMGYLTDAGRSSDLSDTYPSLWVDGIPVGNVVTYMDSHDEQWLMYRNLAYGNGSGSYQVKELATALERQKVAGAFFFTVPGPRMIWQFGELGYGGGTGECLRNDGADECPSGTPGRVGAKPIRWEYRTDPLREKLYKTWAALLKLRNENALFTSPSTQVVLRVGQGQADRWIKLSNLSLPESTVRNAVIVGNFGVVQQSVAPGFPEAGTWYDYFTGDPVDVTEPDTSLALLPGEFHIYTDQYVEPPEPGLITVDTEDEALPGFRAYKLGQNYPNPFRDETTISYAVPKLSHVKLVLYDLLGRQIAVLVDSVQAAGPYQVSFDARHLSGGMYVYRLEAEGHTLTRKMLLVK
ncbi:MAG TPA: alpha-amylase family glycosyl hydrolase, partial [Rhodothermales bacterium]|nr:alpha-amylase family glycosyl hydrolase [Rhodothermales bacterium]